MQKMIRFCYLMFLIVIVTTQIIQQMLSNEAIAIQKQYKNNQNILIINYKFLQRIILVSNQLSLAFKFYITLNNKKIKINLYHLMSDNLSLVHSHKIRFSMMRRINNFYQI